jgi:alpha-mannosidase
MHRSDEELSLEADLTLYANSPVIRIDVRGSNGATNHRLRLGLRTDVVQADVIADAAFGPVRRAPLHVLPEDMAMEQPPPTAPLHRYVSLFNSDRGATLFSDGLAEYEAATDGTVYVTLVRAVGALSRNDIPERPGHAGWPAPTPEAQCLRPFAGFLALLLHGPRTDDEIQLIERTADDVLLPLVGDTLRSALTILPDTPGVELVGDGLAFSALKESENGKGIVARCVNLLDHDVEGAWRFGFPLREVHRARLDETPLEKLLHEDTLVPFRAGPREIVTILVVPATRDL